MKKRVAIIFMCLALAVLMRWCLCGYAFALQFPYISPEALKELLDRGSQNVLVVDTQPKIDYQVGHIKGAINFPWTAEINSPGTLPSDRPLILYCDRPNEKESLDVADQLTKWDFVRIRILKGGLSGWRKLGYPMETIAEVGKEEVPRVTIEELKKMLDAKTDVLILDVQPKNVYQKGHIRGALSFPWKATLTEADVSVLPRDKTIVAYCDCGPGESDSTSVAEQLQELGFDDVKVLKDPSIAGWKKAGYPME
jgi:rhodanese-related sulfurtransferase